MKNLSIKKETVKSTITVSEDWSEGRGLGKDYLNGRGLNLFF